MYKKCSQAEYTILMHNQCKITILSIFSITEVLVELHSRGRKYIFFLPLNLQEKYGGVLSFSSLSELDISSYKLTINNPAINSLVPSNFRHEFESTVWNFLSWRITVYFYVLIALYQELTVYSYRIIDSQPVLFLHVQ